MTFVINATKILVSVVLDVRRCSYVARVCLEYFNILLRWTNKKCIILKSAEQPFIADELCLRIKYRTRTSWAFYDRGALTTDSFYPFRRVENKCP